MFIPAVVMKALWPHIFKACAKKGKVLGVSTLTEVCFGGSKNTFDKDGTMVNIPVSVSFADRRNFVVPEGMRTVIRTWPFSVWMRGANE